jgi:hypothetical protein
MCAVGLTQRRVQADGCAEFSWRGWIGPAHMAVDQMMEKARKHLNPWPSHLNGLIILIFIFYLNILIELNSKYIICSIQSIKKIKMGACQRE